jgi:hypothetical protein
VLLLLWLLRIVGDERLPLYLFATLSALSLLSINNNYNSEFELIVNSGMLVEGTFDQFENTHLS